MVLHDTEETLPSVPDECQGHFEHFGRLPQCPSQEKFIATKSHLECYTRAPGRR